ncbi:MAG: response regulator [Pseudomonadota bacterium]
MKKLSILIIDDSDMDCYLLKRELEYIECEATIVEKSNGVEALAFFKQHETNRRLYGDDFPPLLVFLDINMPLMDGKRFLQEYEKLLHDNPELESSNIIMFTSSKNPQDIEASKKYNFVKGYLVKGQYTEDELKAVIFSLLSPC